MAVPFGGHIRFSQYLEWARLEQGCDYKSGVITNSSGRPFTTTTIEAPSGRWTVEVGTQHNEFLAATTIDRLDRKLGLKSPFFSLPDDDD